MTFSPLSHYQGPTWPELRGTSLRCEVADMQDSALSRTVTKKALLPVLKHLTTRTFLAPGIYVQN
jgi:hypothetical protein